MVLPKETCLLAGIGWNWQHRADLKAAMDYEGGDVSYDRLV